MGLQNDDYSMEFRTLPMRSSSTIPSSLIPGSSVEEPTFTTTTTTGPGCYAPTSHSAQDPCVRGEATPAFPQVRLVKSVQYSTCSFRIMNIATYVTDMWNID